MFVQHKFVAVVLVSFTFSAFADTKVTSTSNGVSAELKSYLVTSGTRKEASKAKPGDVIEYVATYKNNEKTTIPSLMAVLPVPAYTSYVMGSAKPKKVQASLDGTTYADIPLTRKEKAKDGREQVVVVPVSEYRFLRWNLGALPAAKSVDVSARMQLDSEPSVKAKK